jgi:hypothetical protein
MGWRVISGRRRVWCRHCPGNCTHRPAGQCTYTGTVPATNRSAECGAGASANGGSAHSALNWIVGITAGGQGQERATRCCSWPHQTRHRFTPSSTGEVLPVGMPHSNAGRCFASGCSDRGRSWARAEGVRSHHDREIRTQTSSNGGPRSDVCGYRWPPRLRPARGPSPHPAWLSAGKRGHLQIIGVAESPDLNKPVARLCHGRSPTRGALLA